jgi:hypothetical protein
MPPGLLSDESLYCKAFVKMFPDLAKIPWLQSGTPLVPCFRKTRGDIEERLRWTLINLGIPGVSAKEPAKAAEYDLWMRTSLRSWVQTLFPDVSPHYFETEVVQRLVREQLDGRDHSRLFGVLLAQEIWQRQVAHA